MGALAIPLQAQAPQPASPLQNIGQIMALGGQMSEIALRREQIKTQQQQQQLDQVEQAQKNRDLADQNTLAAKEKDPDFMKRLYGGDLTALAGLGLQDKTVQTLNTHVNDTIAKKATTEKADLENQGVALGRLKDTAINLTYPDADGKEPDIDTVNSRYQSARGELAGLMQKAGFTAPLPESFGSMDQVRGIQANLHALQGATEAALAQKKTQGDIDKSEGDAAQAQAQAAHLTATLPKDQADAQIAKNNADFAAKHGGLTPEQFEGARHNKASEAVAGGELGLKQKTFDVTLGSGLDALGQPLSPEAQKAAAMSDPTAVAIAHYQIPPPPTQTRGGIPSPILRKVLAINPQYSAPSYAANKETAEKYAPGGVEGQKLTAADTALSHLHTLSAAGEGLKNGDMQIFNRLGNALGVQLGDTPKVAYDTVLNMVGPEISKAVIGAVGGEGERVATAANFDSSKSPQQREAAIASAVNLLGTRYDKSSHAYEQQMGVPLPRTLSPDSQAIRQHYSGGGSAPVPHVTSKAQFDALPSGSVYTEDDGKQYRKP